MAERLGGRAEARAIQCRAAVARKAGEPLIMEYIVVAPPKAREVRVRIICTSICRSDVLLWKMEVPPACFPRILGHKSVGIVESVGEDVHEFVEGDYVIPVFLADCGECVDCRSKKSNLCSQLPPFTVSSWMPRDGTSRFRDLKGEILYHFLHVSSFRVGAAWRTANVEAGSTIAIFGLGAIGLAVAEGARPHGAIRIIGIDVNPDKFEIGKKFGVTDFVNPSSCGSKSVSQELQLDEFVTHEMKFDEINKALELLVKGKCLRCVLWMDK